MIGKTSQTVEVERQREAEMFKLYEKLTRELDDYDLKIKEAEGVVSNFANNLTNLTANACINEKHRRQQTYFYRGAQK